MHKMGGTALVYPFEIDKFNREPSQFQQYEKSA